VYSLTAAGRRVFDAWMARPPDPDQVRSELLLKIFFGARTSLELTEQRLLEHQRQQRAVRAGYRQVRTMIGDDPDDRPEAPFWRLSLRRGELLTEARLRWCRESLETSRRMRAGRHSPRETHRAHDSSASPRRIAGCRPTPVVWPAHWR
jgi:hypothetical protein